MYTFMYYLRSALPLLFAAVLLGSAAAFIAIAVAKRRGRILPARWKLWVLVSCIYVFALFMLLVVRGEGFSMDGMGWYSLDLFHEYRSLARSFTSSAFINILMNILVFAPFGFLFTLPFGESKKRWLVIPLGILATLAVEGIQLIARSGIADVDDVFNNTLGVICGYAAARMCLNIRARRAMASVACALISLACLAPPFAAWAASSASAYGLSEHEAGGRAPVTGAIEFSGAALGFFEAAPDEYAFYTTPGGTVENARECASGFFDIFGTAVDMEIIYDSFAYIRDEGPRLVVYHYAGPEVEYSDPSAMESGPDEGLTESELRAMASDWGVEIPAGAELEELGDGQYRFTPEPGSGCGGSVELRVRKDGLTDLHYAIYELTPAGNAAMLTEEQCAAALKRGAYDGWIENTADRLGIASASVEYTLDSKGTYRPMLRLDTESGDSVYLTMPESD